LALPYLLAGALLLALGAAPLGFWLVTRRRSMGAGADAERGAAVGRTVQLLSAVLLLFATMASGVVHHRLGRIAPDWPILVAERGARRIRELDRRIARSRDGGRRAVDRAARLLAATDPEAGIAVLGDLHARSGVAALGLFDARGEVVAWAGDHHGPLPPEVKTEDRELYYAERPLFGYLYVSKAVEGRGERVVAAILLQSALPLEGPRIDDFATRFADAVGVRPFFSPGAGSDSEWTLAGPDGGVVHARFDPITQAEWRAELAAKGRRLILPPVFLALVFLSVAWLRTFGAGGRASAVPLLAFTVALAVAPLGSIPELARLFSPAAFLLPIPFEVSLGRLLALLLPLAALTAVARPAAG